MKKHYLLIIILLIILSGCVSNNTYKLYDKSNLNCGFDTFCTLTAYTESEDEFNKYYNIMVDKYTYYHQLFDIYHNYENINNLKTINDNAGIKAIEVDKEIIELLKLAKQITELSEGFFDITNGSLLRLWHEYRDAGKLSNNNDSYGLIPSNDELQNANKHKGFEHVIIDDVDNTVYIDDVNISLDVGAIAKGYATQKIAETLINEGMMYGSVNGGGNQRIIGSKPNGNGYKVGIQNPRVSSVNNDGIIAVIPNVINQSVVTSGDYQNYYIGENNIKLSHIIDYRTLMPANYFCSVTIIEEDSGLADALSTTIFTLSYEEGLKFIEHFNQTHQKDLKVIWISEKPLDSTSIKANSSTELYITTTSNLYNTLITK